uniref:Tryptophan synthase alpha chain n=1 Tax=Taenioma perpusillum TaxID=210852 RepID=A0A1Z1MQU8_9FLOR|nr:Tryptophan synthase alpha subunit [Taenioma perpusillum]ARW68448.1 Tryptophan synthase alpha subunit [Taenioma perpusillum]
MQNIISKVLSDKKKSNTCALVPFITAGYPSLKITANALYTLDKYGADIIELGIPYLDALADGPIIQRASQAALNSGVYIDQILGMLKTINLKSPLIIFTYYNPILSRGVKNFINEIAECGVQGLIIPDLPFEEIDYIAFLCEYYCIELVLFVAPTSSKTRIINILNKSTGCIYLVSSTGVTGFRKSIASNIKDLSSTIKLQTNKLIMLGFGISNKDQAFKASCLNIDGIVVGSAFIKILSEYENDKDEARIIDNLKDFCSSLRSSIYKY